MLGTDLITFHWSLINAVVISLFYTHTPFSLPTFYPPPLTPLSAGLPLAPVELEVVTGDSPHQLQLSWSPPFYSLLIQDLATGLNRTVEPLSLTVFTYQLSEMEALACHSFIFSVFSLNEVGLSINSSSTVSPSLCILDSTTIVRIVMYKHMHAMTYIRIAKLFDCGGIVDSVSGGGG